MKFFSDFTKMGDRQTGAYKIKIPLAYKNNQNYTFISCIFSSEFMLLITDPGFEEHMLINED
jgi:hypothetical protein